MKSLIKNTGLLIVVGALSYLTAPYFGGWYNKFSPQYDNSFFNLPHSTAVFIAGIPVAYVFFVTLIFSLFGFGNKKKWLLGLLTPPFLLWLSADRYYIYLPTILG